ncbi:MAG: amidohydrolase family protein [Bryobacterales bacterium]|nr:amidohydrolase family protein [Bryobacterales bacterium]
MPVTRRAFLAALAASPPGPYVENTTHMFSSDQATFPYHPLATRRPPPLDVEKYNAFVKASGLTHTVIVHSEAYQDDHRYLEYCFHHEPSPNYFKGTCLYDPTHPDTPRRIGDLAAKWPKRIVGMRIHEYRHASEPPTTAGPLRDRDLRSPAMKKTWLTLKDLGMVAQLQMVPSHAPQVAALAKDTGTTVLLDHLALPARGTPAEYEGVIALAKVPNVIMKISSLSEKDKDLVKRLYDAYGPARLVWGSYGSSLASFQKNIALSELIFDYASEHERRQIRGGNALKLFGFAR